MTYKERYRIEHAGEIEDRAKRLKIYKLILSNITFLGIAAAALGFAGIEGNTTAATLMMLTGGAATAASFKIGDLFDESEGEEEWEQ